MADLATPVSSKRWWILLKPGCASSTMAARSCIGTEGPCRALKWQGDDNGAGGGIGKAAQQNLAGRVHPCPALPRWLGLQQLGVIRRASERGAATDATERCKRWPGCPGPRIRRSKTAQTGQAGGRLQPLALSHCSLPGQE